MSRQFCDTNPLDVDEFHNTEQARRAALAACLDAAEEQARIAFNNGVDKTATGLQQLHRRRCSASRCNSGKGSAGVQPRRS